VSELSAYNLDERILKATAALGFAELTPVQEAVLPAALSGKDLIVSSRTGSGKTAAFILPMLQHFLANATANGGTRALILSPTRELALQTQKQFEQLAAFTFFKSGLVIGGEPFKYQIASIRRNPEVIVATPGRLVEHLERKNLDLKELEFFVLDEADLMLDMGFAEDLFTISSACSENRQSLLFSATFKHKSFMRIREQFKSPELINIDGRCFVFCRTRLQCQKVSNILRAEKIRSEYIHGELAQSDRKQVMNRFRDGKLQVLVATDLAARGLDVDGVNLVINFTVPGSGDEHLHRIGRTGRAGEKGVAVSLVDASEWNKMSSISRYLKIQPVWRKLKGLEAEYKGPKKLKKSGKAAGTKKKKGAVSAKKKPQSKKKPQTKRNQEPSEVQKSSTERKKRFGSD